MIGGLVLETIILPDRVWVNCGERQSSSQCAIYVKRTPESERIMLGDKLWWQGGFAIWTPATHLQGTGKQGKDYEVKIPRIGFSGASRPEEQCKTR